MMQWGTITMCNSTTVLDSVCLASIIVPANIVIITIITIILRLVACYLSERIQKKKTFNEQPLYRDSNSQNKVYISRSFKLEQNRTW